MNEILTKIHCPDDVKSIPTEEIPDLADALREEIIETVSKNGGHLASNLGTVELTIALMRVFNPPKDKIIFDVSHQAYSYKLLTGRAEQFDTLRKLGGLSGFLKRDESKYDAFGSGHAGNALSAAIGFAVARDINGSDENIVAVIGDGSISNGISMEAMNNISSVKKLVIVLNDNEMSISRNVGAFGRYLGRLLANPRYNRFKYSVERTGINHLGMSWLRHHYYRLEAAIKSLFLKNAIFEAFGLRYIGPIDGHDPGVLRDAFEIARDSDKPVVVHVATKKGKGYKYAEENPAQWHGAPAFDIESGKRYPETVHPSYSSVFGKALTKLAEKDKKIIAITAAMAGGTGLEKFAKQFPDRFFDVGICEEHLAVFAAGLAAAGMKPVAPVYSTFFQRAVDPLIHDIAMQNLPVVFCLDRAGVVPQDGATHHGVFDIVLLRSIPNLTIMQPRNEVQLASMLATAFEINGPVVIRYPRNCGDGSPVPEEIIPLPIGAAEILEKNMPSTDAPVVALWTLGNFLDLAHRTSEELSKKGIGTILVDAKFIRPLDVQLLKSQILDDGVKLIATFENGMQHGGFGSEVQETLADSGIAMPVIRLGWPDKFMPHASTLEELETLAGISPVNCAERIAAALQR